MTSYVIYARSWRLISHGKFIDIAVARSITGLRKRESSLKGAVVKLNGALQDVAAFDRPADAESTVPPEMPWPDITGIDRADARARWCGDAPLFMRMLARLFEEFADVSLPVEFSDSAFIDPYMRRMHKLRGGACMLGARAVYELASEVEDACLQGNHVRAAQASIKLSDELRRLHVSAQPA